MRTWRWVVGALALAGCPSIGPAEWASVQDRDGDGEPAERFGGRDCRDDDPAVTDCDQDRDGFLDARWGGSDCDDEDPTLHPQTPWFPDDDLDGFGDEARARAACRPPPGHVRVGGDCDDQDRDSFPGNDEECDSADRDCSGDAYDVEVLPPYFVDADGDSWGVPPVVGNGCLPPPGHVGFLGDPDCDDGAPQAHPGAEEIWYDGVDGDCLGGDDDDQDGDGWTAVAQGGEDCGDTDPDVFPGAPERCNGVDDDCDGAIDDAAFAGPAPNTALHWPDADGDDAGDPSRTPSWRCLDAAHPGFALVGDDCDDTRAEVSPRGGRETCNGRDDDCDGVVDLPAVDAVELWVDGDGDGWGSGDPVLACAEGPGLVGVDRVGDCDDGDPTRYPGAPERCGDDRRQDCRTDRDPDDCDADGAAPPADCLDDPTHPRARAVFPGAPERCDGVDNDCDGLLDDQELTDPATWPDWYVDVDGDGYGGPALAATRTCSPPPFAAPSSDDCDDSRPDVFPGAVETCDGRDQDCDQVIDDAAAADATAWHADADGDGFGTGAAVRACEPPPGSWSPVGGDCHDADDAVSPAAPEVCGRVDDDCDGAVDDADPDLVARVYRDDDGDGAGRIDDSLGWCGSPPAGFAATADDCDDGDPDTGPGAPERCNGRDDDCDGLGDLADPDAPLAALYTDADADGFTPDDAPSASGCPGEPGYATAPSAAPDCDDADPTVAPDQPERCRPGDDDCDGLSETDPAEVVEEGLAPGFADLDGDGWGAGLPVAGCAVAPLAGDCDDDDPAVRPNGPGAPLVVEVCNGRDDDCDGAGDNVDPLRSPLETGASRWARDADGDGFTDPAAVRVGCAARPSELPADDDRPEDCDDEDPLRSPALAELCDGRDNDCDQNVDESGAGQSLRWADLDADTYGGGAPELRCPGPGTADRGGDCDDADGAVTLGETYCADLDTDGYRDPFDCAPACDQPVSRLPPSAPTDCDDADSGVQSAVELCNGLDDDCSGVVDDGVDCAPGGLYWPDDDADGFGDPAGAPSRAAAPGFVSNPLDCDDATPGDVHDLGRHATWSSLRAAWDGAGDRTCALLTVDASLAVSDDLTVLAGEALRLRAAGPGLALVAGGGGLRTAGDLVLHRLDLTPALGPSPSLVAVTPGAAGVLTVAEAEIDLTGAAPTAPLIAGEAGGVLRTAGLTVRDGPQVSRPAVRAAGSATHHFLTLRDVAYGIEEAGAASTFWSPVFADVPEVFWVDPATLGGATQAVLDHATMTRSALTLASPGASDWTLRAALLIDSDVRSPTSAASPVTLRVEDCDLEGGGVDVRGAGALVVVDRTTIDGAPGDALSVDASAGAVLTVTQTAIGWPAGTGIRFAAPGTPAWIGTVRDVVVAGAGADGLAGSDWQLERVTVVGAEGTGVARAGAGAEPVLTDAIAWGSAVDLGPDLAVTTTLHQSSAAPYPGLPGLPGFVRYDPAADPATWDLRLHPVDACTDAEAAGAAGGPVGFAPPLDPTDLDGDGLPDLWETSWFGGDVDPAADPDGDGVPVGAALPSCANPIPYP